MTGEGHNDPRPAAGLDIETAPAGEEETLPATAGESLASDDTQVVSRPGHMAVRPSSSGEEEPDPVRIGRFVVIRRLGAGGMGVVYAAYDETLDRKVAVKLLRSDRADGTGSTSGRARLLREAQALARLSHPNVVHVYEVGTFEDQVFVAMEFIQGETLKRWQSRPDRDWREVIDIYLAAGRGLSAAHAAGIVHRDFKPDNVLVGDDGGVRVLDFGLAREASQKEHEVAGTLAPPISASGSAKALSTPLTQTGALMGTPAYMAPEQFHGRSTDARTDQFAFCVSLYEGLYGERPFAGKNMAELAHDVVTGAVSPAPDYTRVPAWLRKAVLRGLEVRVDARYAHVDELLAALSSGLRRRSIGFALAMSAVAVAAIGGVVGLARGGAETAFFEVERAAISSKFVQARARGEQLRRETGRGSSVAEQWDRLVLAWAREHVEEDPTLGLAALANLDASHEGWGAAARMLATAALERGVAWRSRRVVIGGHMAMSADGKLAATVLDGVVHAFELDVGAERELGRGARTRPLEFSPNGQRIAGVSDDGYLAVWGDEPVRGPACAARKLAWMPSSGELVAICPDDTLVRWKPGEPAEVQTVAGLRDVFVWPDGESVAVLHSDGMVRLRTADGLDVRELGQGDPLGLLLADPGGDHLLATGRHARRFAFSDLSGSDAPAFDGFNRAASSLGARLAVTVEPDGTAAVRNADGELVRRLAHGGVHVEQVGLSDDGTIALTVDAAGSARFWRLGDQPPTYIGSHASPVVRLAFVGETRQIVSGTDSGTVRLWDLDARKGRVLGQHPSAVRLLVSAPNGTLIASASREPGVRLWSVASRTLLRTVAAESREGASSIAWSPQGQRLAVGACQVDGDCPVLVHDVEADATRRWGEYQRAATRLVFSPEGGRLLALHPNHDQNAPTLGTLWELDEGRGHDLEIGRVGLPIAAAFVEGGGDLRIAFAANERTQLRVLRFGPDESTGGLVFAEKGLMSVVADAKHPTVLIQDASGVLTLWDLGDDAVAVVGEREAVVESIVVAPGRDQILIMGGAGPARVVELSSGESRNLLKSPEVAAWGPMLAAAAADGTIAVWEDVAPTDAAAFSSWVRDLTDASVDLQAMR